MQCWQVWRLQRLLVVLEQYCFSQLFSKTAE
jgi:hypothetical protein